MFWQYDSRLGRRWNVDPIMKEHESSYATFSNNPIWFIDPLGLDTLLPNVTGNNFYLPDEVEDINYFNVGQFKEDDKQYCVEQGSIKNFTIKNKTYNATFNTEDGSFTGYKTSNNETYDQFDHLPLFVRNNVNLSQKGRADLISFTANLESTFIVGANISWQFNILSTGDESVWFYSTSVSDTYGLSLDWGGNINEAWYVGPTNLRVVTKQDVAGKFTYWQGNLGIGYGEYKGYDTKGKLVWKGKMLGFGFGIGGSYGEGRTIISD